MKNLLNKLLSNQASTCATIIVMFTYTILLDRDFACTCKGQAWACRLYMTLPFFIVFLLSIWTHRLFLRVCRYSCASCSSEGCTFLLSSAGSKVVDATSVGLLWVVFVLIDGDWYVCCQNDRSDGQALLGCKAGEKITEKEQVMISELKNKSRVRGAVVLLAIITVGLVLKLFVRMRRCCDSKCCHRTFLYDELILEEEENVLRDILRKSAVNKLTEEIQKKIKGDDWEECLDVAQELVRDQTKPDVSEREAQRGRRATENQELGMRPDDLRLEEQSPLQGAEPDA